MAFIYWYNTADADWNNVDNWYNDFNHTDPASSTPQAGDDVVILGDALHPAPTVGPSAPVALNSFDSTPCAAAYTFDLTGTSANAVTIGNAAGVQQFNGDAVGSLVCRNSSEFEGNFSGPSAAEFHDTSIAGAASSFTGSASFLDNSLASGCTFNGATCDFNGNSSCDSCTAISQTFTMNDDTLINNVIDLASILVLNNNAQATGCSMSQITVNQNGNITSCVFDSELDVATTTSKTFNNITGGGVLTTSKLTRFDSASFTNMTVNGAVAFSGSTLQAVTFNDAVTLYVSTSVENCTFNGRLNIQGAQSFAGGNTIVGPVYATASLAVGGAGVFSGSPETKIYLLTKAATFTADSVTAGSSLQVIYAGPGAGAAGNFHIGL